MKNKIKRSEIQSYFEENSQPVESSQPDHSQIFEPQMPQEIDPIDSHEQKVEKTIVGLDAPRLTPELIAQSEEMSDDEEEETEPTFTRHRKRKVTFVFQYFHKLTNPQFFETRFQIHISIYFYEKNSRLLLIQSLSRLSFPALKVLF